MLNLRSKRKQDYSLPDYPSNSADKKGKNKGVRIKVQWEVGDCAKEVCRLFRISKALLDFLLMILDTV